MDSFEEFRSNLNQMPKNTRSSLIDSEFSRCDPCSMVNHSCDICRRQGTYTGPENTYLTLHNEPRKTLNQFEKSNVSENSSNRNFQETLLSQIYNTSSRSFNLSDLRNGHMIPRNHEYPDRTQYLLTAPPSFNPENYIYRMSELVPYDESGRTFNLSDFATNHFDKSSEKFDYTYDTSNQHLSSLKSKQNKDVSFDKNEISFHQNQSKKSPRVPRNVSELKCEENVKIKSTLPLRNNFEYETLVKDHYFPGIIVDTVNGIVDFNKIAFNAVFHCENIPLEIDPETIPMSLLEAFSLRIEYEQNLREDHERRKMFCTNEIQNEHFKKKEHEDTKESHPETYRIHRDELKLASTIDIDLMTKVGNFPETPLTQAINSLLKAEKINNFDRSVHLAEEAIRAVSEGQEELAALKSTCSFKMNLHKDETKTTNMHTPLEIISYIGTTQPNNDAK